MNKKQFKHILIIGAGLLGLWLLTNNKSGVIETEVQPESQPLSTNPSVTGWIPASNDPTIIWGQPNAFFSTTLEIPNDFLLGSLARQYIPLFGFSGVTGVGEM